MEGLFTLLTLSIVMAVTSFLIGALPLSFTLSTSQSRFISSLGMGILVGTALVIIIPEGVETLYSSQNYRSPSTLQTRGLDVRWQHRSSPVHILPPRAVPEIDALPGPVIPDAASSFGDAAPPKTPTTPGEVHALDIDGGSDVGDSHKHEHEDEISALHAWIGISLISGFILMYIIDKLPSFASPPKARRLPYHISLDNLGGSGLRRSSSPNRDGGLLDQDNNNNNQNPHSFAMTTGLVIHAAADGIALGVSGSNSSLSFIIFLALLVHKAPAAFGLTSVLLKQGLSSRVAGRHLLVFSLAAPVGALMTFIIVHTLGSGFGSDEASNRWRTGVLLLFSAGTFLYVAMHTIQDIAPSSSPSPSHSHSNGYADSRETPKPKGSIQDLAVSVVGMILPLFLQIGHAH